MTRDEQFLTELYRASLQVGGEDAVVDPHLVAKKLRFKEHLTKELLKSLCKANLVKLYSPNELVITQGGSELARSLLG